MVTMVSRVRRSSIFCMSSGLGWVGLVIDWVGLFGLGWVDLFELIPVEMLAGEAKSQVSSTTQVVVLKGQAQYG